MVTPLVQRLADELDCGSIRYCHWKENYRLQQSLDGHDDLEILVDRRDKYQIRQLLSKLGFRSAVERGTEVPSDVSHFFGFDSSTGQLVHIHLYLRIATGESFVKSHWLPCEELLLENVRDFDGINVPSRSAELIVHILRVFVKYGSLLDLIYLKREEAEYAKELRWLETGASRAEVSRLLHVYGVPISETLFGECLKTLRTRTSLLRRIILSQQVRHCLRRYERHTVVERHRLYARLLFHYAARRLLGRRFGSKKAPATGGTVIAFVGPEATGKSTLVAACKQWLDPAFNIRTIHAGKPPSAFATIPVNAGLDVVRQCRRRLRSRRTASSKASLGFASTPPPVGKVGALLVALRAVALAWDRRQLLVAARRSAAAGDIVICDRYPSRVTGAMDSPRLYEDASGDGIFSAALNRLARLERYIYDQIPAPDVVLRLNVSPTTAKQRNRERIKADKEGDEYLEMRHRQSGSWDRPDAARVYYIDTEQPLDNTIRQMKLAIWEAI